MSNLIEVLPDDLKNEPSLSSFLDKEDGLVNLAKSYVHQSRMIGSSIRIPTESASQEDIDSFMAKVTKVPGIVKLPASDKPEEIESFKRILGVPEKAEDYKIDLTEDLHGMADEATAKELLESAHKLGLTHTQAKDYVTHLLTKKAESIKLQKEFETNSEKQLRELFGADYDNRIEGIKVAAKVMQDKIPNFNDFMTSESAKHPAVAVMLTELAKHMKEGNSVLGKPMVKYGPTPHEALMEIEDLRKSPAYRDGLNPEHRKAVEKMTRLYASAYPDEGQAVSPL